MILTKCMFHQEYTSEEILGQDNAWLCPSCNRKEKGVKRLALWSLPDILIVHLKRFRQVYFAVSDIECIYF